MRMISLPYLFKTKIILSEFGLKESLRSLNIREHETIKIGLPIPVYFNTYKLKQMFPQAIECIPSWSGSLSNVALAHSEFEVIVQLIRNFPVSD